MPDHPSERRVLMARSLARRWLEDQSHPEHRVTVYFVGREARGYPSLLRSFRDSRLRIGSIEPITDLGVSEGFDSVTLWSSNREGLAKLAAWFEERGFETTGVW